MTATTIPSRPRRRAVAVIAIAAVIVQLSGVAFVRAQEPAAATEEVAAKIPPEELDSLVAPIALYPDPLLAQVLVASTYPLELIQLQQWLKEPRARGRRAGRGGGEAALGPEHPVDGGGARCGDAPG